MSVDFLISYSKSAQFLDVTRYYGDSGKFMFFFPAEPEWCFEFSHWNSKLHLPEFSIREPSLIADWLFLIFLSYNRFAIGREQELLKRILEHQSRNDLVEFIFSRDESKLEKPINNVISPIKRKVLPGDGIKPPYFGKRDQKEPWEMVFGVLKENRRVGEKDTIIYKVDWDLTRAKKNWGEKTEFLFAEDLYISKERRKKRNFILVGNTAPPEHWANITRLQHENGNTGHHVDARFQLMKNPAQTLDSTQDNAAESAKSVDYATRLVSGDQIPAGSAFNALGAGFKGRRSDVGGIDLTTGRMKVDVDSDNAAAAQPMDLKALENIEINQLYIKSIEIKSLNNLPQMLGVSG
ncbi:MAG: hypothetical protein HQL24_10255 [Candidatus Omnitrophica bacterium]|nr:hypothetical protein [Candidatus Omnitrophota bacterium]